MHFGLIGYQNEDQEKSHPAVQLTIDNHQSRRMDLCPKIGEAALAFEEGCKKCYGCGYSEC